MMTKIEMDKARIQFDRIHSDSTESERLHRPEVAQENWTNEEYQARRQRVMTALFADIHFLLICLDKLGLLFRMLERQLPREPELKVVHDKYNPLLKDSNDFRNHLEHIDERVARGVSDLGNLVGTSFSFDGKRFEIGPGRRAEVESFFRDLVAACQTIAKRQDKISRP